MSREGGQKHREIGYAPVFELAHKARKGDGVHDKASGANGGKNTTPRAALSTLLTFIDRHIWNFGARFGCRHSCAEWNRFVPCVHGCLLCKKGPL